MVEVTFGFCRCFSELSIGCNYLCERVNQTLGSKGKGLKLFDKPLSLHRPSSPIPINMRRAYNVVASIYLNIYWLSMTLLIPSTPISHLRWYSKIIP